MLSKLFKWSSRRFLSRDIRMIDLSGKWMLKRISMISFPGNISSCGKRVEPTGYETVTGILLFFIGVFKPYLKGSPDSWCLYTEFSGYSKSHFGFLLIALLGAWLWAAQGPLSGLSRYLTCGFSDANLYSIFPEKTLTFKCSDWKLAGSNTAGAP